MSNTRDSNAGENGALRLQQAILEASPKIPEGKGGFSQNEMPGQPHVPLEQKRDFDERQGSTQAGALRRGRQDRREASLPREGGRASLWALTKYDLQAHGRRNATDRQDRRPKAHPKRCYRGASCERRNINGAARPLGRGRDVYLAILKRRPPTVAVGRLPRKWNLARSQNALPPSPIQESLESITTGDVSLD